MSPHLINDETHYRLLKHLEANPETSQRELARELGISLGKANYCLKALVERGWVKMGNFSRNPDKGVYTYLLTPRGIEEKTLITIRFLKYKMAEYEALRDEVELLRREVAVLGKRIID
ncbi:MAG: MarR family EPS-associated transcriptional regulator [Nitrospirota bacterium]|nr:MarR family EPS-associated transcriptional regulator [Nitrospirota bacterium]